MDKKKHQFYISSLKRQEDDVSENNMISKEDGIYIMAHAFNSVSRNLSKIKKIIIISESEHSDYKNKYPKSEKRDKREE